MTFTCHNDKKNHKKSFLPSIPKIIEHMRNCHDKIATKKVIIMFPGDSMARYDGLQFSTRDRDNDGRSSVNCAKDAGQAGWWYKWFLVYCSWSNLNGVYHHSPRTTDYTGIWWGHWHGWYYSLKATTMMVRNT